MDYQRKPIKGFEGYEIDTNGVVYSCRRTEHVRNTNGSFVTTVAGVGDKWITLKQSRDTIGYLMVYLQKDNRKHTSRVHKLVAETFIPNLNNAPCVCHRDGNNINNNVDNLYWGTHKENVADSIRHGTFALFDRKGELTGNSKLNEKQVRVIKHILTIPNHIDQKLIAKIFRISPQTISYIKSGKLWNHVII